MVSITKYKGGYRAFVMVGGKRTSKTFDTKREAVAWAAAEETAARERKILPESELRTVRDMLIRYAREVSPRKKGARPEQLWIAPFIRNFSLLADRKLAGVKTPDLAEWRNARLTGFHGPDGKKVAAVSSASVLRDIAWLSNAFTVAKDEWHWIEHKPFDGLRPPPSPPPRDRRVSPSEVRRICRRLGYVTGKAPETKQQEVALAFLVGLRSAMRAGEILSLGKGNLDLQRRIATVQHKMQHLTGKPRISPTDAESSQTATACRWQSAMLYRVVGVSGYPVSEGTGPINDRRAALSRYAGGGIDAAIPQGGRYDSCED
jgi:integrase